MHLLSSLSHLVWHCLPRSGSSTGFLTTSAQPVAILYFLACINRHPSTSSSRLPSSLFPLSLSLSQPPQPPTPSLLPLCTCLSPPESYCATVPCGDLQLFLPPASPVLFTQERCRRKSVSDFPPLKTQLLDWSYLEWETKKSKGRECAQTKRRQASVYVSEIQSRTVYSEQRRKKKK